VIFDFDLKSLFDDVILIRLQFYLRSFQRLESGIKISTSVKKGSIEIRSCTAYTEHLCMHQ